MTNEKTVFNEDYFERGVEKQISGYQDYRWLPHYVLPMANELKKRYGNSSYLDFGCAKGFLVKALKLLGCDAYGFDTSEYAIKSITNPSLRKSCHNDPSWFNSYNWDTIIAKDVLEHIKYEDIDEILMSLRQRCSNLIVVVPLGDGKLFRIREYEIDKTHVIREDEEWWINKFVETGFETDEFYYKLTGFKDNWTERYPYGNGIFFLK